MSRRRKKNNTILGIIACICILVLGVGIAGALTQGFTNADPYGWLAKAKQEIDSELNKPANTETNKTNDSNETNEPNTPVVNEPYIYGELLTDGEEIRGIGFRSNVTPDWSKIDWTQDVMGEDLGMDLSYLGLEGLEDVGLMYTLKTIVVDEEEQQFGFYVHALRFPYSENNIFMDAQNTLVPEEDGQGNIWQYYLLIDVMMPMYSSIFTSDTYFAEGSGVNMHFNDNGWIDSLSLFFNTDDLGTNCFLPFRYLNMFGEPYDDEIYSEIHIYEKDFLDDIFFKLGENDGIDVLSQGE